MQPAGIVAPCCTSDGCSTPSEPQDAPYTCDISQKLYLCVNDGVGAECVDPKAKTICSGNFSGAGVPSGTSGTGGSQTASSGNGRGTASHPLSTSAIIGICVAGFVVLVILGLISEWMKKKSKSDVTGSAVHVSHFLTRNTSANSPCDGSGCSSDDRAEKGDHV